MSALVPFVFPATCQEIRAIGDPDAPLFHLADVCKVLQHTNPTVAARMLDEDDSVLIDLRSVSAGQTALNSEFATPETGNATARFVTEPGLYTLVFNSKAPGAKEFRRWVTHEVLPAIRKTGSYNPTGTSAELASERLTTGAIPRLLRNGLLDRATAKQLTRRDLEAVYGTLPEPPETTEPPQISNLERLAADVLTVVQANPGITANKVCNLIPSSRVHILAALRAAVAKNQIYVEAGSHRSRRHYLNTGDPR